MLCERVRRGGRDGARPSASPFPQRACGAIALFVEQGSSLADALRRRHAPACVIEIGETLTGARCAGGAGRNGKQADVRNETRRRACARGSQCVLRKTRRHVGK